MRCPIHKTKMVELFFSTVCEKCENQNSADLHLVGFCLLSEKDARNLDHHAIMLFTGYSDYPFTTDSINPGFSQWAIYLSSEEFERFQLQRVDNSANLPVIWISLKEKPFSRKDIRERFNLLAWKIDTECLGLVEKFG